MKFLRSFGMIVVLSITTLLGFACAKPCNELRDLGCERTGEASAQCAELKEMAEKATMEDARACTRALEVVNSLSKNK
ncbi:MAG: hypothetical protein HUU55_05195 [Myxococcales bacterium]|nr:hypothetical protein [Myxococcales bacterium]